MIDWNNIETVFLDMDGTLLDLHYDNYFWLTHLPRRFAELKGLEYEEVNVRLNHLISKHQGTLNWYCLDFWTDELDIDLLALKHEVASRISYRPNAKQFLQALKDKGYRAVLVTNAHRGSIDIKFHYTDLESYLDDVVCSHDYRKPKEDVSFWADFHRHKPFEHKKTLFIDDNDAVLRSARKAGIGQLVSIALPDSQQAARQESEFLLMSDFGDVLPHG